MILNNTQANIFKVNGGIADNFANRPAASGSFYIFYSIDTQEIFYDNGAWVLLGSGGGGGVNIYNSDGTLTGNRTLDGNDNNLQFTNTVFTSIDGFFAFNVQSNRSNSNINLLTFGSGFNHELNILRDTYIQLLAQDYNNNTITIFRTDNNLIKTIYQNQDIGLKLDFANSLYQLGQITGGGQSLLTINDTSGVERIFTSYQGNEQGIELQFNAGIYRFGHLFGTNTPQLTISESSNSLNLKTYNGNPSNTIELSLSSSFNDRLVTRYSGADNGIIINFSTYNYVFGRKDANNFNYLEIDDTSKTLRLTSLNAPGQYTNLFVTGGPNAIIKTQHINVDNGIKLDFANTVYQFGQITGGNTTYLNINDITQQFSVINQSQSKGLYLDFQSNRYFYGDYFGLNAAYIEVDASQQRIITKGTTPGQSRGLDLLPNSSQYYFGNSTDLNRTFIQINDFVENIFTSNKGVTKGISLNFATNNYQFGQITGGNITKFIISDAGREIYTSINNSVNGLLISQSNDNYKFGVFNGGNVTNITITDGAVYPIRLNGNNLSSGTASGSSGQHLKININGTPYKIALLNP